MSFTVVTQLMTLFRCQIYLAGQKAYLLGTLSLPHKVDGDLLHDRQTQADRQTNDKVSKGLRFSILIQEDAKV